MPDCGEAGATAADVESALHDPDVVAALAQAPVTLGTTNVVDLPVLVIEIDGREIQLNCDSSDTENCTGVPDGITRLRRLLERIQNQQLGIEGCKPPSYCYLDADPGPCTGVTTRYAYDPETHECVPFTYGGCGGNQNNFSTSAECLETCALDPCRGGVPAAGSIPRCGGGAYANSSGLCFPDPGAACSCACAHSGGTYQSCTFYGTVPDGGAAETSAECPP